MNRNTLSSVSDVVIVTSSGSRELSDEVLLALGWTRYPVGSTNFKVHGTISGYGYFTYGAEVSITNLSGRDADGKSLTFWQQPGSGCLVESSLRPDPTRSLDDAVALVPDGYDFTVGGGSKSGEAKISRGAFFSGAKAATPALSLSACALRVIAAGPS